MGPPVVIGVVTAGGDGSDGTKKEHANLYLYIYIYIILACVFFIVFPYFYPYLSIYFSIHQSICLSLSLYTLYLSIYLSIHLSIYLCLSVCLSICLSVCLSVFSHCVNNYTQYYYVPYFYTHTYIYIYIYICIHILYIPPPNKRHTHIYIYNVACESVVLGLDIWTKNDSTWLSIRSHKIGRNLLNPFGQSLHFRRRLLHSAGETLSQSTTVARLSRTFSVTAGLAGALDTGKGAASDLRRPICSKAAELP